MSNASPTHFDPELMRLASPLPRIAFTSREQIAQLAQQRRPAIFTGALDDWPAHRKWNPEYFREHWGDRSLHAHETRWQGTVPYLSLNAEKVAQKTFAEFIDGATREGADYDLYVHQLEASKTFPGSDADLAYDRLIEQSAGAPTLKPNVWMGTPGTRSGLHFDSADNLIAMFHGAKAFMLVDPRAPQLVYPFRNCPTKSAVDPAHVDWKRFPRLREASIYIDVLRAGELLFLPHRWWHYLTSVELAINATCWFYWKGVAYAERKSPFLSYLPYLLRCGPSYLLHFIFQFFWYGMLRRPYQAHALSPPPPGARVWAHVFRSRRPPAPRRA